MFVLIAFLLALAIGFGYAFVAYLDAAPVMDEDEAWSRMQAKAIIDRASALAQMRADANLDG